MRVTCQKCGMVLRNTSENIVEHFLVKTWISYYYEEEYNTLISESNRDGRELNERFKEYGDDIDTWFDVNTEFADRAWICPKCKTMHVFDRKTNDLKDIYWRLPVKNWDTDDFECAKNFFKWIDEKKIINEKNKIPNIKEGEIWWVGVGENVGVEINGKSALFSRPVLIMRKLSRDGFMGIPLTSQEKKGKWYVAIDFLSRKQYAAICQARVYSVNRLFGKMGTVPESDLNAVKEGFLKLYG